MPLFEYRCLDCGESCEILVVRTGEEPHCPVCGTRNLKKLLSAPSALSGTTRQNLPGPGETACCGSTPSQATCAGPGSCCGK